MAGIVTLELSIWLLLQPWRKAGCSTFSKSLRLLPLANPAMIHHLVNVTVPCQQSGGWLAAVMGTVLRAALHVDGLS